MRNISRQPKLIFGGKPKTFDFSLTMAKLEQQNDENAKGDEISTVYCRIHAANPFLFLAYFPVSFPFDETLIFQFVTEFSVIFLVHARGFFYVCLCFVCVFFLSHLCKCNKFSLTANEGKRQRIVFLVFLCLSLVAGLFIFIFHELVAICFSY